MSVDVSDNKRNNTDQKHFLCAKTRLLLIVKVSFISVNIQIGSKKLEKKELKI